MNDTKTIERKGTTMGTPRQDAIRVFARQLESAPRILTDGQLGIRIYEIEANYTREDGIQMGLRIYWGGRLREATIKAARTERGWHCFLNAIRRERIRLYNERAKR